MSLFARLIEPYKKYRLEKFNRLEKLAAHDLFFPGSARPAMSIGLAAGAGETAPGVLRA